MSLRENAALNALRVAKELLNRAYATLDYVVEKDWENAAEFEGHYRRACLRVRILEKRLHRVESRFQRYWG